MLRSGFEDQRFLGTNSRGQSTRNLKNSNCLKSSVKDGATTLNGMEGKARVLAKGGREWQVSGREPTHQKTLIGEAVKKKVK
jgi:hypothetical protein